MHLRFGIVNSYPAIMNTARCHRANPHCAKPQNPPCAKFILRKSDAHDGTINSLCEALSTVQRA